jgi:DNA-binding LytR/AlgR family response regulator
MITCIIIEDEPKAQNLIREYVLQTTFLQLLASFDHPLEAIDFTKAYNVDLVFTDINLPVFTGIDLAEIVGKHSKIIFTTAYSEYAVKSYEQNAVDYLVKPITYARFLQGALKARELIERSSVVSEEVLDKSGFTFLRSGKELIPVKWSETGYIEGHKEYAAFLTEKGKVLVYRRMKDLEELVPQYFVRVHNSFIVNMKLIGKVEGNTLIIFNKEIPITEKYKDKFWEKLKGHTI